VEAVLLGPRAVGPAAADLLADAAAHGARRVAVISAATVEYPAGEARFAEGFKAVERAARGSGLGWSPLLVVVCDQDETALAAPAVAAAGRAPSGELVRIPGGHYEPFLGGHEQVVQAEVSFLRRHLFDDPPAPLAAGAADAVSGSGGRA
jgi:pimeloyl-ACP methyl ester carboxylesterase